MAGALRSGCDRSFRQQSRSALAGIEGFHKPVELLHVAHLFGGDVRGITGQHTHRENLPAADYLLFLMTYRITSEWYEILE